MAAVVLEVADLVLALEPVVSIVALADSIDSIGALVDSIVSIAVSVDSAEVTVVIGRPTTVPTDRLIHGPTTAVVFAAVVVTKR